MQKSSSKAVFPTGRRTGEEVLQIIQDEIGPLVLSLMSTVSWEFQLASLIPLSFAFTHERPRKKNKQSGKVIF